MQEPSVPRIGDEVVRRYLARLDEPGRPRVNLATLVRLHERHVRRVPYHNLDIQVGLPTDVDPAGNAARLADGDAGYCFHLNGAFAALLAALGFDVTLHRGQVKKAPALPDGVQFANHLTMTVRLDGRRWFVDVGLGDGLLGPVPLRPGAVRHPPLSFAFAEAAWGWRFTHDPRGSFTVMDWEDRPARPQDFVAAHQLLSTASTSTFVRRFIVTNRGPGEVVWSLVDRLLTRIDGDGVHRRELTSFDQWRRELEETFLLRLDDRHTAGLRLLWQRLPQRPGIPTG
ncbi:arylamine N-acetyltransferase family protein [Micromonospora wenchangensis]|uniref:arylamine N-acetyltransferase family protein n=1 Tax=Micromonospora wenchangensis TaxID=1185415 RepID=UPI003821D51B